jgi:VanZ family protein
MWLVVLWMLSSNPLPAGSDLPPIPHLDKVAHFGYFFVGGSLIAAFLYRSAPASPRWSFMGLIAVLIVAAVGALDEYHQTFVEGRSGNDPWDWLADVIGAWAGTQCFRRFHRFIA